MSLIDLAGANAEEAARQMGICNACRYCEGLCAVFPAMEERRTFGLGDVDYLANLCHNCGACYHDCQYAPPHEFAVNVPVAFADLREESYARYAWPGALAGLFERNGLVIALLTALSVTLFIAGFVVFNDPGALFTVQTGEGAFYALMPHNTMVALFGSVFVYALLAMAMSVRGFWRATGGGRVSLVALHDAAASAARLRNLDGGGIGCMNEDDTPTDNRRVYHHATFYGFLLCLASTSLGTVYHYGFGWQAPYPVTSPVVILGTLGGIGLLIGPAGLYHAKRVRAAELRTASPGGMDVAFLAMLFLTSLTGLALLVLRETAAMNSLLAIHLGVVFALFLTMPYGKFVHGLYRFAALVRHATEQKADVS